VNVPLNTFKKGKTTANSFQKIRINVLRNQETPFQIDCRGMRLEEFQHKVETAISDLIAGDTNSINIIHGHGDGVLKSWLRNRISKSKEFKWSLPENGNDGETEIRLKD
jgi:DNA mismatch repair protein MutS2